MKTHIKNKLFLSTLALLFCSVGFSDYKAASTKPSDDPNLAIANGAGNNLQLGFSAPSVAFAPVVSPAPAIVPLYRQTNPAAAAELIPVPNGKDVK